MSHAAKYIELLGKVEKVSFCDTKLENAVTDVSDNLEVYIPLSGVDLSPIKERLSNQKTKLEREITKLNGMLSNKKFVENAPANVVEQNQKALDDANEKLTKVEKELKVLS